MGFASTRQVSLEDLRTMQFAMCWLRVDPGS